MNPIAEILAPTVLPNVAGAAARAQVTAQTQEAAPQTDADFANVLAAFRAELGLTAPANDQTATNTLLSSTAQVAANANVTTPVANVAATSLLALGTDTQITTTPVTAPDQSATVDASAMLATLAGLQTTLQQMQQPAAATNTEATASAAVQTNAPALRGTITAAEAQIVAQTTAQTATATAAASATANQATQATPVEGDAATANVLASLAAQAPQPKETKQLSAPAPIAKPAPAKAPKQAHAAHTAPTQTTQAAPEGQGTKTEASSSSTATLPPAGVTADGSLAAGTQQPQTQAAQPNAAQQPVATPVVATTVAPTTIVEAQQLGAQVSAQAQANVSVDTLAVHIARKFEAGSNEFSIRLHPAELGQLDISLSMADDGHVQAVLRAERPETLDMLQKDARVLEQQLRQAGLEVGSNALSFSLSGGGSERQAPFKGWPGYADAGDAAGNAKQDAASTYIAVRTRDGIDIRV